jgi:hypothetical protein
MSTAKKPCAEQNSSNSFRSIVPSSKGLLKENAFRLSFRRFLQPLPRESSAGSGLNPATVAEITGKAARVFIKFQRFMDP